MLGGSQMKAWKLVSLLLAIALIVTVVFCVNLNNSQKLANDALAKANDDLKAAEAIIAEKEQALTDAHAASKPALDQAVADKDAAVAEVEAKLTAELDTAKADLEAAAADKESAVAQAVKDGETKLAEAVSKAKAEMQAVIDQKDALLAEAQATIEKLQQQIKSFTTP